MQEPEKRKSRYTKLAIGKNKLRIVSQDLRGWECWIDEDGKRKPIRQEYQFKAIQLDDMGVEDRKQKQFYAWIVWNYQEECFQCWQVTQSTIIQPLLALSKDENWGDAIKYDIVIDRQGEKLTTTYNVVPNPHKPFEIEIPEYELDQLFKDGHPLKDE